METSAVARLLRVLCVALVAPHVVMAFQLPDLTPSPEPDKPNATRDFYQKPSEFDYNADVSCMTTGPSCVRSCAGRGGGNYQSCTSCTKYVSCATNGDMMLEMPCPRGSQWDSIDKTCRRKRSRTCIPCPVKSVSWFKDKHAGYSLPDNKYFTAGVAQQVYRWPDFGSNRDSTLRLRAPPGAKAIQFYLSFYESPWQYAFHISNYWRSDGWGKWDGSSRGRYDAEIHSYNGDLYAFDRSKCGGHDLINRKNVIKTHLYIKITRHSIYVNNFRGCEVCVRTRVFSLRTLYFGLNRIINRFQGATSPADRIGSGLDAVWISWILK
ncbi:hypothetical protein NP493_1774g00022 [Ridgeia piscesae]|uniref:Chitin-binding type-2 domain-containing protein n=1 Tax=Ridgeia piscesae TaxID=27915 RepID=A0AAD9JT97_RIDPI|nr:hypothetical protein NP493_1774g00022 [Ridgeia piscesae]